jgi:hypothetical protein
MDDTDVAGASGPDKPHRNDIPCQIVGSLDASLRVHTNPYHLSSVQIQAATPGDSERALVVLTLTLDDALDLCLRLIAAAGRLRAQATRS